MAVAWWGLTSMLMQSLDMFRLNSGNMLQWSKLYQASESETPEHTVVDDVG